MKKRVTSFLLSFLMVLALIPASHVHAETNSESAASALGASKYNRTWSGDFGYKVTYYLSAEPKGKFNRGLQLGAAGNSVKLIKTLYSFNVNPGSEEYIGVQPSYNRQVLGANSMREMATSLAGALDLYPAYASLIESYTGTGTPQAPVALANQINRYPVTKQGTVSPPIAPREADNFLSPAGSSTAGSNIYVNGELANYLGNPMSGGANSKIIAATEPGGDNAMFLALGQSMGKTSSSALAKAILPLIPSEEVSGRISTAASKGKALEDLIFPIGTDCQLEWVIVVEPLIFTQVARSNEGMLEKLYDKFWFTEWELGFVNGVSRIAAMGYDAQYRKERQALQTRITLLQNNTHTADTSSLQTQLRKLNEDYEASSDSLNTLMAKGEFADDLYSMMRTSLPSSLYITEGWFRTTPAAGVSNVDTLGAVTGTGVGIFHNQIDAPPPVPPCCSPNGETEDPGYCPCDGPGSPRCHCPPGCDCNPTNPPPGCDCVDPPREDLGKPFIDEQHITQELRAYMGSDEDQYTINYNEPPTGGEYWVGTGQRNAGTDKNPNMVNTNQNVPYTYVPQTYHDISVGPMGSNHYVKYDKLVGAAPAMKIMRNAGGNALLQLPDHWKTTQTGSGGPHTTFGKPYAEDIVTWISHRHANGAIGATVLAKYMTEFAVNKTAANEKYKTFVSTTNGMEVALEDTDGSKIVRTPQDKESFSMEFHLGDGSTVSLGSQQVTYARQDGASTWSGDGEASPVPDATKTMEGIKNVTLRQINFDQEVDVHTLYYGRSKPQTYYSQAANVSHTVSGSGESATETYTFTSPSETFKFYPTFEAQANYRIGGADEPVNLLSKQARYFRGVNRLTLKSSVASSQDIAAPWSRDRDDASYTMKAGNAYTYQFGGATISVNGWFHLIDPKFAPDYDEAVASNDIIMQAYFGQINQAVNAFSGGSLGIYSNLYEASYRSGYTVTAPNGSATGKESLMWEGPMSGSGGSYGKSYNFLPGNGKYPTSNRTFMGNGMSSGDPTGSNQYLVVNFETGGGDKIGGWYNENFQGIIVCHVSGTITLPSGKTDFAAVHTYQSDWQTAVNATATPITTWDGKQIHAGSFGIGAEADLGSISWGEAESRVVFMISPKTFNVRGSAFDTVA